MVEHEDVAIAEDVEAGVPIVAGNNEVVEVNSNRCKWRCCCC